MPALIATPVAQSIAGTWTWTDAAIFIGVFVIIRIIIIWMATKMFIAIIPDGDCCPLCDSVTLPIERNGWWRVLGARFRRSWCLACGWEGVLRRSPVAAPLKRPLHAALAAHGDQT